MCARPPKVTYVTTMPVGVAPAGPAPTTSSVRLPPLTEKPVTASAPACDDPERRAVGREARVLGAARRALARVCSAGT